MAYFVTIDSIRMSGTAFVVTTHVESGSAESAITMDGATFVQTEDYTKAGIAVQPYGAIIYDGTPRAAESPVNLVVPNVVINGQLLTPSTVEPIPVAVLDNGVYSWNVGNGAIGARIEISNVNSTGRN